jgi:hypothetical protein
LPGAVVVSDDKPKWYRPPAPYERGNEAAVTHGAYSPRRVDPLALELVDGVIQRSKAADSQTTYLLDPSFRPALWAWARCEVRVQLVTEWLMDRGSDIGDDGEVLAAAEYLRRWEAQALKHRERLGLDPLARAKLGKDVAAGSVDMARLMAELSAEDAQASNEATT